LNKINNHLILPESRSSLDHASLTVNISIIKEFIQDKQQTIIRNSEKKEKFVTKLINTFKNINTTNISSIESLEEIVQEYAKISNSI